MFSHSKINTADLFLLQLELAPRINPFSPTRIFLTLTAVAVGARRSFGILAEGSGFSNSAIVTDVLSNEEVGSLPCFQRLSHVVRLHSRPLVRSGGVTFPGCRHLCSPSLERTNV